MAKSSNPEQQSLQKYLSRKKAVKQSVVSYNTLMKANDMSNNETARYLHWLVPNIFAYFDKNFWHSKIEWYKKYVWFCWDREFALRQKWQAWRSNFITPLTRVFTDSLYNRIFDSEFSIDVYSTTPTWSKTYEVSIWWDKVERSPKKSVQALNERAYITSDIDYNLKRAAKDAVQTWDWFWRVDMDVAEEYQKWIEDSRNNDWKASTKWYELTKCNAVAEYIPWEEIIYEWQKDFYESEFVWWRRIESQAKFENRRWRLVSCSDEVYDYINTQNPKLFFSKNYSKFRNIKQYEHLLATNAFGFVDDDIYWLDTENLKDKWETYEHWTKETLTICRNWYVIYDWANPYGWIIPFVHLWLGIAANQWTNDWITQLLYSTQTLYDLVYNWYTDYLKRHFNPMYMSTWAQRIEGFETWYLDWEPYKIIKNLWEGKVERMDLWDDVTNGFSMLQSLYEMASQISWVTRYTWAWSWSGIERSSRAADYQVQITLEVLKPIVSSISRALDATSKIWCKLAQSKLPPKCIVSIMGEKGAESFKKITLEDLSNDFVIKYNNQSIADYTKTQKLNDLERFMQYWQQLWQDQARQAYIIDQAEIIKKIWELLEIDWVLLNSEEYKRIREEWWVAWVEADTSIQAKAQEAQAELQPEVPAEQQSPEEMQAIMWAEQVLQATNPENQQVDYSIAPTVVQ